jgi:hypothetical protein
MALITGCNITDANSVSGPKTCGYMSGNVFKKPVLNCQVMIVRNWQFYLKSQLVDMYTQGPMI